MSDAGPFAGRTVLLLRPEDRDDELASRLSAGGAHVRSLPAIAFEPPADDAPARSAVMALARYDLVVFTSPTGVRAFGRLAGGSIGSCPRVAAIGPATARALRELGIEPAVIATDSRSEGLLHALRGIALSGRHVLVVRPEVARTVLPDALASRGARVDAVAFYRTVPAAEARVAATEIVAGRVDAVVFTSPSTLRCLLRAAEAAALPVRAALAGVARVAIGPVTATALADEGVPAAAVAHAPTPDAVAEAVTRALRARRAV